MSEVSSTLWSLGIYQEDTAFIVLEFDSQKKAEMFELAFKAMLDKVENGEEIITQMWPPGGCFEFHKPVAGSA